MKMQIVNVIAKMVFIAGISLIVVGGYHTFYVKKNYIAKSDIYVIDTNKVLQRLAQRVYNKTMTTDELRRRVEIIQDRINNHDGIVFEMGALPGHTDNDIQTEFEDLVTK